MTLREVWEARDKMYVVESGILDIFIGGKFIPPIPPPPIMPIIFSIIDIIEGGGWMLKKILPILVV